MDYLKPRSNEGDTGVLVFFVLATLLAVVVLGGLAQ